MIQQLRSLGINVREGQRGDVKVICPKCSQSRKHKSDPCLSVNTSEGVWNCHNCGWSGTVKNKVEYVKPPSELKNLSSQVIDWFAARGISNQTLLRYKVSEGIDYMPQVNSETRTIHFNYIQNDEVFNIKFRDRDKNFKLVSGARLGPSLLMSLLIMLPIILLSQRERSIACRSMRRGLNQLYLFLTGQARDLRS
jgi:twinkle protein